MVAFNAVHNFTWQLPKEELERHGLPEHPDFDPSVEEYVDWYDGAISPNLPDGRRYYLAQLELMDRHIGRILDAVEASDAAEDTLVVYLTDNGGSTCNFGDNTPLDGTKYTLFEGGIRVPFIVRWPGVAEPGSRSDALVSALDLMPTFVTAASGGEEQLAGADGQDLAAVLTGGSDGHEALYFDTGAQQAVVRPDMKWRRIVDEGERMREALLSVEHTDIGTGEHLVRFHDGLADETVPSDAPEEALDELRAQFERWRSALTAP
jgi:arylsulfatase A-like enzyme